MVGNYYQWSVRSEIVIKERIINCYFYVLENASDWKAKKISQNPSQLDPKQAPGDYLDPWRSVNTCLGLWERCYIKLAGNDLFGLHTKNMRFPVFRLYHKSEIK